MLDKKIQFHLKWFFQPIRIIGDITTVLAEVNSRLYYHSEVSIINEIIKYSNTPDLVQDVCGIIDSAQQYDIRTVDATLVLRNWLIGKRISEESMKGEDRAAYGGNVIDTLSEDLKERYGKGYSRRALYQYVSFFRKFAEIVHALSTQLLSWTHYRTLLSVEDPIARDWYEKEHIIRYGV